MSDHAECLKALDAALKHAQDTQAAHERGLRSHEETLAALERAMGIIDELRCKLGQV